MSHYQRLPIPKRMRWGSSKEEFVRPVQWAVLLFNGAVYNEQILGLTSGNSSRGHRFHSQGEVIITSPDSYAEQLYQANVIVDFAKRRDIIRAGAIELAASINGQAVIDDELLDEVSALNEWPVPLMGRFDEHFLAVPAQALISSMKEHQKYFHVVDQNNQLMSAFITVANIQSKDPAQVIDGNERVIRPRLADAAFFYNNDKKTRLDSRRESLKQVVFQAKLGSVYAKTERVAALAEIIAPTLVLRLLQPAAPPNLANQILLLIWLANLMICKASWVAITPIMMVKTKTSLRLCLSNTCLALLAIQYQRRLPERLWH